MLCEVRVHADLSQRLLDDSQSPIGTLPILETVFQVWPARGQVVAHLLEQGFGEVEMAPARRVPKRLKYVLTLQAQPVIEGGSAERRSRRDCRQSRGLSLAGNNSY